jgi:hypothetical protein
MDLGGVSIANDVSKGRPSVLGLVYYRAAFPRALRNYRPAGCCALAWPLLKSLFPHLKNEEVGV